MRKFNVGESFKFRDEFTGEILEGEVYYVYTNHDRYDVTTDEHLGTINVLATNIIEPVDKTTSLLDELEELQHDIEDRGEYLEKYTYEPFQEVQEFATRLRNIIDKYY